MSVVLIDGEVTQQLLTTLGQLNQHLDTTAKKAEEANQKATQSASVWQRAGQSFSGAFDALGTGARHFNEIVEAGGRLLEAANHVSELATQQSRLEAATTRLGLDFTQASNAAGRYAQQTDVMRLATTLAGRDIQVTQRELNSLTVVAQHFAQDRGVELEQAFETLGDVIAEGGEEAGKFGLAIGRMGDSAHDAHDRLGAVVEQAQRLGPVAEDAASRIARLNGSLQEAQRLAASGFVNELMRLNEVGSGFRGATTDAEDFNAQMRAVGQTAAYVVAQVGNVAGVVAGSVGSILAGVVGAVRVVGAGLNQLVRGNFSQVGSAFSRELIEVAGRDSTVRQLMDFTAERARSLSALATDSERTRTSAPGEVAPARPAGQSDMVFTLAETQQRPRPSTSRTATDRTQTEIERARAEATAAGRLTGENAGAIRTAFMEAFTRAEGERQERVTRDRRTTTASIVDGKVYETPNGLATQAEMDAARAAMEGDVGRKSDDAARLAAEEETQRHQAELSVRLFERQRDAALSFRDAVVGSYDAMTKAGGDYLAQIIATGDLSEESAQRAINAHAREVASKNLVDAARSLAEGIYYSFTAPPIAASKFLAAAKFGALGLGAGLVARATNQEGAGGGTSGAASRLPGGPLQAPLRGGSEGGGGAGTQITIVYGGGVLSTPRDLARHMTEHLGLGARQGNILLSPQVIGGRRD